MNKSRKIAQKRKWIGAVVAGLLVIAVLAALVIYENLSAGQLPQELEQARVIRVVDGDTLIVNVGGVEERLRLIGIDAPESVHQDASFNTPEGAAASDFVKTLVSYGQTVYLQKDLTDRDQYGRLLRYVWLEVPDDLRSLEEVRTKMLNGIIVANGHAVVKRYEPDTAYYDLFQAIAQSRTTRWPGLLAAGSWQLAAVAA